MKKGIIYSIAILMITLIIYSCAFTKKAISTAGDAVSNVNVFPYTQDIELGKQVKNEIESQPNEFPILPRRGNERVYDYVEDLKRTILNTNELRYKNEFAWEIKLIDDDKTLNAFATPGGYIYIYTGLIKFLDSEDEFIGVLGHEMAHSDRRHSTRQLTKTLGISMLLDAVLGNRDAIEQVIGAVANLRFSRSHESEADEYSVRYLCNTEYNSDGAAGFFVKLKDQPTPPEFMSTHPNPANRIENMRAWEEEFNCSGSSTNEKRYNEIKRLL